MSEFSRIICQELEYFIFFEKEFITIGSDMEEDMISNIFQEKNCHEINDDADDNQWEPPTY